MSAKFKTRTTPNPLNVLELKEESEGGFNLVGFTYNNDEHYYHYIFVKYEQGEEAANTDSKQAEPATPTAPSRFMFKNALISIGVKSQTADDWIKVRKAKRAAQTETAFKTAANQIKLIMDTYGVTADDVVRIAVERNWQGIMLRYYDNVEWKDYGIQVGQTDLPFDNNGDWQ